LLRDESPTFSGKSAHTSHLDLSSSSGGCIFFDRSEGVRNPYDGGRVRNPYSSERRGSKLIEGTVQDQSSLNKEFRLKELSQNLRSEKRKVEKRKIKPSEA